MIPSRQIELQKIGVTIDDVDLPNRIAHARDKTNVVIQVSFRDSPGGILHIPKQGERWVITRLGHGPWYLDTKLDSQDEHSHVKESMNPGDTRLSADSMHILNNSAYMNNRGLGTTVKDNFYSSSPWTAATLSSDPATQESIHPMLNGILITPDLYKVVGRSITFNHTMAIGSLVITYQVWQSAMDDAATVVGKAVISAAEVHNPLLGDDIFFGDPYFTFDFAFNF